jgi:hypothetical protein
LERNWISTSCRSALTVTTPRKSRKTSSVKDIVDRVARQVANNTRLENRINDKLRVSIEPSLLTGILVKIAMYAPRVSANRSIVINGYVDKSPRRSLCLTFDGVDGPVFAKDADEYFCRSSSNAMLQAPRRADRANRVLACKMATSYALQHVTGDGRRGRVAVERYGVGSRIFVQLPIELAP